MRHKNVSWSLPDIDNVTWEQAQTALLMDLRDELQDIRMSLARIRLRFDCSETLAIPSTLKEIAKNTTPRRRPVRRPSGRRR